MQFRIAHPTSRIEWPGWRDTVLVDVCNPIVWHAPPLARVVIPETPSGDMYSLVTSHSCIIAVCFFSTVSSMLLHELQIARQRFPHGHAQGRCLLVGIDGKQRSSQAKQREGMVRGKAKVTHQRKKTRDERKSLPDTIHGGHRVHGLHEARRTGVGSRQCGCRTSAVQRASCGLESSERLRGRVRSGWVRH
jgi:hypothetical protein